MRDAIKALIEFAAILALSIGAGLCAALAWQSAVTWSLPF